VKLLITPNSAGFSEISLTFSGAENTESATYVFNANAEEQDSQGVAFGLPASQIGLIALLFLVLIGGFVVLTRSKRGPSPMLFVPPLVNQVINQQPNQHVQPGMIPNKVINTVHPQSQPVVDANQVTPAPICWQCRNPVLGKVVGCPSCGARYCGTETDTCKLSSLETCLSCKSPVSTFVTE
jgi:hypothetical protein